MSALRIKTADSEKKACEPAPLVLTIGHSTFTLKEFISLLHAHGATCVVDVRTVPRSRHNPQFNKASLPSSLKKAGLGYLHLPGLGGLRHPKRESLNPGWRNASFRGYADYMQTPEFEQRLDEMIQVAKAERIVLMCVEAVPWRCPGPWYPRRGHHEPDSPPYLFAYSVRQSPRHHDRLSGQGFADHSKAAR